MVILCIARPGILLFKCMGSSTIYDLLLDVRTNRIVFAGWCIRDFEIQCCIHMTRLVIWLVLLSNHAMPYNKQKSYTLLDMVSDISVTVTVLSNVLCR